MLFFPFIFFVLSFILHALTNSLSRLVECDILCFFFPFSDLIHTIADRRCKTRTLRSTATASRRVPFSTWMTWWTDWSNWWTAITPSPSTSATLMSTPWRYEIFCFLWFLLLFYFWLILYLECGFSCFVVFLGHPLILLLFLYFILCVIFCVIFCVILCVIFCVIFYVIFCVLCSE